MDPATSPIAAFTLIAAPALLTNATSLLAMSTTQRMLRTREMMSELFAKAESHKPGDGDLKLLVEHVNRIESQAELLLNALHTIYLSLAAFSGATLSTLLGATLDPYLGASSFNIFALISLILVLLGVGGLCFGSLQLFRATQLSLIGIHTEAAQARARYAAVARVPDAPRVD